MTMPKVSIWRSFCIAGFALASTSLFGQAGEQVDTSELGAYVGAGTGAGSTHAWVGGSTGVSPSKYFLAAIDTSFMPLGSNTLRRNLIGTSTSRLYDFNFQGQILIPIPHRITPYALLGAGVLYNTYQIVAVRPNGVAYLAGRNEAKFGFQTGGGARIFVKEDFGFRGEYRFTASTRNFNRVLFGVFYQFSGMWPFLPNHKRRGTAYPR
jgi:opacity protein-like surface antigen